MPFAAFINSQDLPAETWIILMVMAVIVGIARSGVFGVMVIVVPVLSLFLGGRQAAGFVLPWMILGDWIAVFFYRKNISWPVILRILPWLFLGILLGAWTGSGVSDRAFRNLMGGITFLTLALLLWKDRKGEAELHYPPGIIAAAGVALFL